MKTFRVQTCLTDEEHFQFVENILNTTNANVANPCFRDPNTAKDFLTAKP